MALVPAGPVAGLPHAPSDTTSSIVPFGTPNSVGEPLEQKIARLRSNREAHSRKQIWTKDAHDGPYRKVNMGKGYDPLTESPDGRPLTTELGHERVKAGPTSNFVGNHMTQGAIDLVQADLELPPRPAGTLLAGAPAAQSRPHLLARGGAGTAAPPPPATPLHQYRWTDAGGAVQLEVPVAQMRLPGGGAQLVCTFQARSLDLRVASPDGGTGPSGASAYRAPGQAPAYRLLVQPLRAALVPRRSSCHVRGTLGLPPCSSGSSEAGGEALPSPASSAAQQEQPGEEGHTVRFTLPCTAEAVVVLLAKADESVQWEALQASKALVPDRAAAGKPDLAALRKAVRQQLNRAKPAAPEAAEGHGVARPDRTTPAAPGAAAAAERADPTAALAAAESLAAAGRYAEALEASEGAWLAAAAPGLQPEQRPCAARLLLLRGRCHAQLGGVKRAVDEYSAAIQLAGWEPEQGRGAGLPGGGADLLCQLLMARASLHEQQEQLGAALADAAEAARLQQPPAPAVLLAAQRLRQALRRAGTTP